MATEQNRHRRAAASLRVILLGPPAAVPVEFLEVLIERRVAVVEERFSQRSSFANYVDVLVDHACVVAQLLPEQANGPVIPPATVPDLPAEEIIAARNSECCATSCRVDNLLDLCRQFRRAAFVRIQNHHPRSFDSLDRVVPGSADRREFGTDHRSARAARAVDRIVDRIILDDDHLVRPVYARDAGFDVRGFVVSRDHRCHPGRTAPGRSHAF